MDIKKMMQFLKENYKKEDLKVQFAKTQEDVLKFWESHHDNSMVELIKNDLKLSYDVIDVLYSGTVEKFLEYLCDLDTRPREHLYEFLEKKARIIK